MFIIRTKAELDFFIKADCMMNRGYFNRNIFRTLYEILSPDYIMDYLKALRKTNYYRYGGGMSSLFGRFIAIYYQSKVNRIGSKLGFSISERTFDYGLVIPHWGTIVVGGGNSIGKYAVLHTSTCITQGGKLIGDYFYLSTGSIVTGDCNVGNGITIASNSLLNKSISENEALYVGTPCVFKKSYKVWCLNDPKYQDRIIKIENLKMKYGL